MTGKRASGLVLVVLIAAAAVAMIFLFKNQQKSSLLGPMAASAPPNFALIPPGEPLESIVRTAAAIVPSPRQWAWQRREFIAFVHFGMNTFTDREWGEGTENPALFNPTEFDARQWVRAMKDAGMSVVIVTAKHHDGFCLWPTKFTLHSVRSSPWREGKGDVVGEVAAACREAGLKFGVYLSPWDRHEPSYGDSPRYNEHFRNQLRELLTNYGEVVEVWFDGACGEGPNGKRQEYDWPSYYQVVRKLQPGAVIFGMGPDVRWVGTESGYGRETEWSVVPIGLRESVPPAASASASPGSAFSFDEAFLPGDMTAADLGSRQKISIAKALAWYPAETDVSIRPGWFYHAEQDDKVKTPETLVDIYFSSVGRNGVLLLNVPPDKRGLIHENDVKALRGMRAILDETFRNDLAAAAAARTSNARKGHLAAAILDGDPESYWTTEEGVETAEIEIELAAESAFDRVFIQEHIRAGQRIERFHLDAWDGSAWVRFAEGTTVGHKRLLRIPAVKAKRVRLVIDQSRTNPAIAAFGLFQAPAKASSRP